MNIKQLPQEGLAELWRGEDPKLGFVAYIALHSLRRGPALGGVRLWPYPDEQAARRDATLLAQAMTYKAAVAELPHGGGKGVIIEPKGPYDRALFYQRFAEFTSHLQGRYISAKDVGTDSADIVRMRQFTRWVTGLPPEQGGAGDPSPMTAYGIKVGLMASAKARWGKRPLRGLKVVIQGLGAVGTGLARLLHQEGCELMASDVQAQRLAAVAHELGVHILLPEQVLTQTADVFSPCALGQVLDQKNIAALQVGLVAGGANDQLSAPGPDAEHLRERGILYAPDFVLNAGGLIHVAAEWAGYDETVVKRKTEAIGATLTEIYQSARQESLSTLAAALRIAKARI